MVSEVFKPHQDHSTLDVLHRGAFESKLVESREDNFEVERIVVVYFAMVFDRNKQTDFKYSELTDELDFWVLAQICFKNSDELVWLDHWKLVAFTIDE